uniref:Si:ch211-262i1.4 n=1 Tax=Astyanax mexicanus TaxID=7994 RepID=A0A3B1J9J9_ASTMX
MERLLTLVEPVVIINKLGTSFFEMSLTLTVYNVSLETADGQVDQAQAASSRFFLIHSIICTVAAMLSTVPLGRVADRRGPKVFLIMSQLGSVMGMCVLLVFLFWKLPLEFLFLGSAVYGLSGGAPAYWAGVVALAALSSKQRHRTLKLNVPLLLFAGVLGGLLSGYVYQIGHKGVVLIGMAISFSVVSLLYSTFLLSGSVQNSEDKELLLSRAGRSERTNRAAVGLLISAMVLFMLGMIGAENILTLYVLKPPLSWDSVWAGYGRAATDAMYLSSFLGVLALSGVLGDTALTLLGIVSNCTGMAIMAFTMKSGVTTSSLCFHFHCFYRKPNRLRRAGPFIETECCVCILGRIFGRLQLVLAVTELLSTVIFTSIYPLTLNSFSGLCFLLSCTISYLSVIPVL